MKIKFIFLLTLCIGQLCSAQYIGVRARYTETRLVDDSPNPPKRENRLVLSFFTVSDDGTYTPVYLTNYDIWIYKQGFQLDNGTGGVLDSAGNNYPGYAWPAPRAVAYYNSLGLQYIDCNPDLATHYTVNGQTLDCGFVTVSYWEMDYGTNQLFEAFPAPNICLPYYIWPHLYFQYPGNVNFGSGIYLGPPYNMYNFSCGANLQVVIRGTIPADSSFGEEPLPVRFAGVRGSLTDDRYVTLYWSNLTESDVSHYIIERAAGSPVFEPIGQQAAIQNDGGRADYVFNTLQSEPQALYRIRAIEVSGREVVSTIIQLKQSSGSMEDPPASALSIYPNPVSGTAFTYRLPAAPPGRYICTLISPAGAAVRHKLLVHEAGDLIRSFDMTGLPAGAYRLILQSTTNRFTANLIYVH